MSNKKETTKQLYGSPGRVITTVLIEDRDRIYEYKSSSTIKAVSGSMNVSKDFNELIRRAKEDAIYQHKYRKGEIRAGEKYTYDDKYNVQVIDFEIKYFDDLVDRKRVLRFDGRTKKEEYWNEVRDKETGKLISRIKARKAELNE